MGTTPITGLPWPENTDPVANGAAAIRNLAETLDPRTPYATALGTATLVFTSSTAASIAVTFPAGRFTAPPLVFMAQQGTGSSGLYAPRALSVTTSGFTVSGTLSVAATVNVVIAWHAIQSAK